LLDDGFNLILASISLHAPDQSVRVGGDVTSRSTAPVGSQPECGILLASMKSTQAKAPLARLTITRSPGAKCQGYQ
jgi:hypothetical protein